MRQAKRRRAAAGIVAATLLAGPTAWAQATLPPEPFKKSAPEIAREFLKDQRRIWRAPEKLRERDLRWLLPATGAMGWLIATDERNMRERIHSDTQVRDRSGRVSDAGLVGIAAVPAYLSWYAWRNNDEYAARTAELTARAAGASLVVAELAKLATLRERPLDAPGNGRFWQGGSDSSFPSVHATLAWAMAPVVAERYPGWMTKVGMYGLATAVSLSRIDGQQHFPSDVVAGSALGWAVGHFIAKAARQQDRGMLTGDPSPEQLGSSQEAPAGTSYVPMDSWVYDALDRLAALGLIPSQTAGLRPWTRLECQRQTEEAGERVEELVADGASGVPAVAAPLVAALRAEFRDEGAGRPQVTLDSVYVRNGVIAGSTLTDGYHFGQTWRNDYGRPFGRGWNSVEGFRTRAEAGRWFACLQGEYQHAPGEASEPFATRSLIASLDGNPVAPATETSATNRFRTIEAYAGVRVADFELSIGKQELYWGPTYDAPLAFSMNAEPTKNGRIAMVHPVRLPGVLGKLGAVRAEAVLGKLGGQSYTWRPWFNGVKVSFKLTENLEMGFTRWSIFWGVGHPITAGSFFRNVFSTNSPNGSLGLGAKDPGDRKAGFDFRYRLPGLRNWLTLYSDTYSDDDPSPLAAPRRAAFSPGLLLTHVPGVRRLDFRVEAASTTPYKGDQGGTFIYYNNQYHSGNTNYGYLLGNPAGRDGRAVEGWSRYWFSERSKVEAGYRQLKIGGRFLPGGGTQTDATLKGSIRLMGDCFAGAFFQYERYWIPALGGPARNLSGWLQLTWEPRAALLH